MLRNHVQSEPDLGKAILARGVASDGGRVHQYTDRVRYVEQLDRYHDVFPSDQVLVLIYDDFRADNEAVVRMVLRFLDVNADAPIEVVDANPTVAPRSGVLDGWDAWVSGTETDRWRAACGPRSRRSRHRGCVVEPCGFPAQRDLRQRPAA